eukprot:TRINITY_DN1301_c0_g1_i1.p1 TRINITY_DN1301_c0_g1~~TRINITY_DN1301_c0_g1_i1.p1  ORF type:complete len:375 (+),score=47.94 TRINITY_DN1301_c0_g1_i1:240-1364(+)
MHLSHLIHKSPESEEGSVVGHHPLEAMIPSISLGMPSDIPSGNSAILSKTFFADIQRLGTQGYWMTSTNQNHTPFVTSPVMNHTPHIQSSSPVITHVISTPTLIAAPMKQPPPGSSTFGSISKVVALESRIAKLEGVRNYSGEPSSPMINLMEAATRMEDKGFICCWANCRMTFTTKTGLATHCSTHLSDLLDAAEEDQHDDKRRRQNCICEWNNCQMTFVGVKQLCKHLSQEDHIGQAPFVSKSGPSIKKKYECSHPSCGKSFSDSSNRKKHEKTHDANRERFHCKEPGCTKSYTKRADLKIHMKVHRGEFSHKCSHPNCGKAFVRVSELYIHERAHDNIVPHLCQICGMRFPESSRLRKHQMQHEELKSFVG